MKIIINLLQLTEARKTTKNFDLFESDMSESSQTSIASIKSFERRNPRKEEPLCEQCSMSNSCAKSTILAKRRRSFSDPDILKPGEKAQSPTRAQVIAVKYEVSIKPRHEKPTRDLRDDNTQGSCSHSDASRLSDIAGRYISSSAQAPSPDSILPSEGLPLERSASLDKVETDVHRKRSKQRYLQYKRLRQRSNSQSGYHPLNFLSQTVSVEEELQLIQSDSVFKNARERIRQCEDVIVALCRTVLIDLENDVLLVYLNWKF